MRQCPAGVVCVALFACAACFEASPPPARSILFALETPGTAGRWGWDAIAVIGDVDRDGANDFAAGVARVEQRDKGQLVATIRSGRNGECLAECVSSGGPFSLGLTEPSAAGDVDGDHTPDLAVSLRRDEPDPVRSRVEVYSGKDGSTIASLECPVPGDGFGCSVVGAGDLDGDGLDDLVIGSQEPSTAVRVARPRHGGSARAISVRDGRVLWTIDGTKPGEELGSSACPIGDVDGDGATEIALGAPSDWEHDGRVLIVGGRDGRVLRVHAREPGETRVGLHVSALPDVDGDGVAELLLSSSEQVRILSGASGAWLRTIANPSWTDVQSIGDVDRDGLPELVGHALRWPNVDPFEYEAHIALLMSGADGSEIAAVEFGDGGPPPNTSVLGDLDADGLADLALPSGNRVYVVSSRRFFFD